MDDALLELTLAILPTMDSNRIAKEAGPTRIADALSPSPTGLLSPEGRDFMGRPPHWLLRSGTIALASMFGLLLVLGMVIKYPDTINALLLGLYQPTHGEIRLDDVPLTALDAHAWRSRCGVVMQDGYIFATSIARNIAPGDEPIDPLCLNQAIRFANLTEYVGTLPNGVNTSVGAEGQGISGGQRQRILLARAVYRMPDFLYLDEATSALDTTAESVVLGNLRGLARDRTIVVIAHRLSTVRDADQIVVLDHGQIVETGTHQELVARDGAYHRLVRNQL